MSSTTLRIQHDRFDIDKLLFDTETTKDVVFARFSIDLSRYFSGTSYLLTYAKNTSKKSGVFYRTGVQNIPSNSTGKLKKSAIRRMLKLDHNIVGSLERVWSLWLPEKDKSFGNETFTFDFTTDSVYR